MADMEESPMQKARRGRKSGSTPPLTWEPIGMTIQELAQALRIDERTVHNLLKTAGLPGRKCGVSWRFDADAVRAWLGSGSWDIEKARKTDTVEEGED